MLLHYSQLSGSRPRENVIDACLRSSCVAGTLQRVQHSSCVTRLNSSSTSHARRLHESSSITGSKTIRSSSHRLLVKSATAATVDYATYEDPAGPAFKDTLKMLEWQRLCEHLSKHASTALGKRLCLQLEVPVDVSTSQSLLNETKAMLTMEYEYLSLLDYGGINTFDAEGAIKRASKGGMVSGKQLRGLVAMCQGADRLKRQIQLVARQNNATNKDSPIWPLLAAVAAVNVPKGLMRDIAAAVGEDGDVLDSASEQVRTTRGRVKAVSGRINNMLKGYPGEASEKSGRLCVAVPAGTKINNGVMLGTSVGGGMVFIEPAAVVSLNNELAAARAEAAAAEETVLWELSGRVMGVQEDVEIAFNVVGWLDLLSAKVRFGMWLGAVPPQLTPWDEIFHKRSGSALNKVRQQQQQQDGESPMNWDGFAAAGAAAGAAVHLRKFSHPLLLADYLEQQQKLERQQRQQSGAAADSSSSNSSSSDGSSRKMKSRLLDTRKEVINKRYGLSDPGSSSSNSDGSNNGGQSVEQQLEDLRPPRPLDLVIQPETSVVVITGPNTGGKTATMKAFGLAVCMAKAGLLVTAQAPARLPCYSSVLADIGDEQSLTANLSTFSGHIKRISALRAEADGRSLLLLDELGTGTDPTEGAALGVALLKQLIKGGIGNGALTIATTHHSIMTSLKFEDPRAENASVEFDEAALAPTYKLLWGVPGRSNALNIAARLGLFPHIVAAARQRLSAGVAAANAAIEELEVAQEQLKQADLAAFAVDADVNATKKRLEDVKDLVITAQQELALKRSAAIQEISAGARQLLRALKQERKARLKGNTTSRVSRQLDAAMDDDLAGGVGGGSVPARAQSLDDAIQSFNALSTSNSKYDTVWDVSQRHWQQQQWQQLKQEEEWVQTWRGLLDRARRTLANTLTPEAAAAAAAAAGGSIAAADIDMQIEAELEAVYASAAAKAVAESEQVATLQKMIDEVASQQWEVKGRAAVDQQVSEELFATGVTLVEQAMDLDDDMKHLQDKIQQQQAATAAAEKAKAEEAARKQAEDAALIAAMETELDTWYLEQIALDEQRQQQQEEEAAAAAVMAESERRQQSADFNAIAAFEDMMLDFDMSASSNTSGNASGSGKTVASKQQHQHKLTSSQHRLTSSSSSRDRSSGNKTSANVLDDLEQLMESVDIDDLLPAPQQQQRQKQPVVKQHGANGIKFRMM